MQHHTTAYFDESHDAALGIVHRPWFEMKLRSHFISSSSKDDPAWYALRNIVYASGCRIVTSKVATFHEAQQASWPFFENSLSVHTQLLYWQTTVTGVQALTAMVGIMTIRSVVFADASRPTLPMQSAVRYYSTCCVQWQSGLP